jgi:hypothetical protein
MVNLVLLLLIGTVSLNVMPLFSASAAEFVG